MTKSSKKDTSKAAGASSTPGPGPAGKLTPGSEVSQQLLQLVQLQRRR